MSELSVVLISSGVGAAVSAIGVLVNNYVTARTKSEEQLRGERTTVYKQLWEQSSRLPLWPLNQHMTYGGLQRMSKAFRDWYFEGGGMYLSARARDRYFAVQHSIKAVGQNDSSQLPRVGLRDRDARREVTVILQERAAKEPAMGEQPLQPPAEELLPPAIYEFIRDRCHRLRVAMTDDLFSRRRASRLFG